MKSFIDGAAVAAVVTNVAGLITGITAAAAGVLTVCWAVIRLYEMESIQLMLPEKLRLKRFRSALIPGAV